MPWLPGYLNATHARGDRGLAMVGGDGPPLARDGLTEPIGVSLSRSSADCG